MNGCGHCTPCSCASAIGQHLHQVQSPEVFIPNSARKIHQHRTTVTTIPFPQMPGASAPVLPTRSEIFETFLNNMYRIIIQERDCCQSCSKKDNSKKNKHLRTMHTTATLWSCVLKYREMRGFDSNACYAWQRFKNTVYTESSFNQ